MRREPFSPWITLGVTETAVLGVNSFRGHTVVLQQHRAASFKAVFQFYRAGSDLLRHPEQADQRVDTVYADIHNRGIAQIRIESVYTFPAEKPVVPAGILAELKCGAGETAQPGQGLFDQTVCRIEIRTHGFQEDQTVFFRAQSIMDCTWVSFTP